MTDLTSLRTAVARLRNGPAGLATFATDGFPAEVAARGHGAVLAVGKAATALVGENATTLVRLWGCPRFVDIG